jgi:ELWxxDGT repeat protein
VRGSRITLVTALLAVAAARPVVATAGPSPGSALSRTGASSDPSDFTHFGSLTIFHAEDAAHGEELWETDGTRAGTTLLKDVLPGKDSSFPGDFTVAGGLLFFTADDGTHGDELWKTDGTPNGTKIVKDIVPGDDSAGSFPYDLTNVGGTLYFAAFDPSHGYELWKSDGTPIGTRRVADINHGVPDSSPGGLVNVAGKLYFGADDGQHGQELWTLGPGGPQMVADINFGPSRSLSNEPPEAVLQGFLYFAADNGKKGTELWRTTAAGGVKLLKDVQTGPVGSGPVELTTVDTVVFFAADDGVNGQELWRTDGTTAGTVLAMDIDPGPDGSTPEELIRAISAGNDVLFFTATDGQHGREIWMARPAGTPFMKKDIFAGAAGSDPQFLASRSGVIFFSAEDHTPQGVTHGRELWSVHACCTAALVFDVRPGVDGSDPSDIAASGNLLFFAADDGVHGNEPWVIHGTQPTTALLKDIA